MEAFFFSGKPAPYWHKHDVDWVTKLQLAKENYRAKLYQNVNAERAVRANKRYDLIAVEQERELKRQRTSKACGKQSSCCSDRLYSEDDGNRNEGNEEAFSSDKAAIAVY